MRKPLIITTIIALFGAVIGLYTLSNSADKQDRSKNTIPAFTFTDITGKNHSSGDFNDKIVILNFWASWCAPCIKEFPHLIKAAQTHPEKVILIALSSDLEEGQMRSFLKKNNTPSGQNILIAHDDNQKITEGIFGITALPVTKIYYNGKITQEIKGGKWKYETLESHLQMLLSSMKNDS